MMTKLNKILIAALVVQAVLAVVVLSRGSESSVIREEPVLAAFDAAAVTRVQIFDGTTDRSGDKVDLVKRGTDWVLASHFDYPAEASRVTDMLAPFAKAKAGEPLATSATRHKQLKVGDTDFERKLVVTANGTDTTIYLGSAAGLRRTAIRIGGSDNVLGVTGISATSISAKARDWVAPRYYETPSVEVTKLVIQKGAQTFELERALPQAPAGSGSGSGSAAGSGSGSGSAPPPAPTWVVKIDGAVVTPAAGETLDTAAIDGIVNVVSAIDAAPADPKRDASAPTLTLTVTRKGGSDTLDVLAGPTEVYVKKRDDKRATSIDKLRLKPVLELTREKLVHKPAAPAPAPAPAPVPGMQGMDIPGMPDMDPNP